MRKKYHVSQADPDEARTLLDTINPCPITLLHTLRCSRQTQRHTLPGHCRGFGHWWGLLLLPFPLEMKKKLTVQICLSRGLREAGPSPKRKRINKGGQPNPSKMALSANRLSHPSHRMASKWTRRHCSGGAVQPEVLVAMAEEKVMVMVLIRSRLPLFPKVPKRVTKLLEPPRGPTSTGLGQ